MSYAVGMPRTHQSSDKPSVASSPVPSSSADNSRRFRKRLFRVLCGLLILGGLLWQRDRWLPRLLLPRARELIRQREPEAALRWVVWTERLGGGEPETALLRARVHRKQGELDAVAEWLEEALRRGAARDDVQREEWLAYAQAGQMQQAGPHLQELLLTASDDLPEICDAYVSGYMRIGQDQKALAILESWIADYPDDPWPVYLRGKIARKQSRFADAEQDFRRVLELDSHASEAAVDLGDVLLIQLKPEEALPQFERGMSDPKSAVLAKLGAAKALQSLGESDQAAELYRQVLAERPDDAAALHGLGELALHDGQLEEAITRLEASLASDPQSLATRYLLVQALQQAGHADEAAGHLEHIEAARAGLSEVQNLRDELATRPDDPELRFRIADLEYAYGSRDDAVLMYLSVLDLAPDHASTHRALAEHYGRLARRNPEFQPLADRHAQLAADNADGRPMP